MENITNDKNKHKVRRLKFVHFIVSAALFLITYQLFYRSLYSAAEHLKADALLIAAYLFVIYQLSRTYDSYDVGYCSPGDLIYSQSLVQFFGICAAYFLIALVYMALQNPVPLIVLWIVQLGWNCVWVRIAVRRYFAVFNNRKTALIYGKESDLNRLQEIMNYNVEFEIIEKIQAPGNFQEIEDQMDGMECICVAGLSESLESEIAKYCIRHGVTGYFAPHTGDIIFLGSRHMRNFSVPIFSVTASAPYMEYLLAKRAMDIIVSVIAIILLSPLMALTALAIRLYDGGPAVYKQVRLTKNARKFEIYKFRSMRVDAEYDGVARLAAEGDERITPVGRIIRAIRFDELPQLFNVLKGDMTLVGPRPERPEIAQQYEQTVPDFSLRLQVKAGLTGFAQVYGKYNTDPYDKLQFDLMYINNMTIMEDIKILLATVKILFIKDRTEGVETGMTTARYVESKAENREKELVGSADR